MDSLPRIPGITSFRSSLLPTYSQMHELRAHLRSNSLPCEAIRSVIASSDVDIARYDMEIEVLQTALGRLISERDALKEYSAAHQSFFSPVRRLPPEILAKIFAHCSPPSVSFSDVHEYAPPRALGRTAQSHLLRLSGVCHHWYETAMHTPSLWSAIEVDFGHRRDPVELLARSLERSADCPLAIHCIAANPYAIRGLGLLFQHSARWRTADIYVESAAVVSLFPENMDFPLLERLEIAGEDLNSLHTFKTASKLTQFVSSVFSPIQPMLPWAQLRLIKFNSCSKLSIEQEHFLDGLAILPSCSPESAVEISALDLSDLDFARIPPSPVECPIRSLDIVVTECMSSTHFRETVDAILAAITLPCLGHLALRASGFSVLCWPGERFLELASRSSFRNSLTKLYIRNILISDHELVDCLSGLPALVELFVQDVPGHGVVVITDRLLRRLTWTADSLCVTPHLASVHFGSLFEFDGGVLLDFVNSRLIPGRTLRRPFAVEMLWLPRSEPRFEPSVAAQLVELRDKRQLRWSVKALSDDLSEPTWST